MHLRVPAVIEVPSALLDCGLLAVAGVSSWARWIYWALAMVTSLCVPSLLFPSSCRRRWGVDLEVLWVGGAVRPLPPPSLFFLAAGLAALRFPAFLLPPALLPPFPSSLSSVCLQEEEKG